MDRLRRQALDWEQNSLSAVRDREVIRTHWLNWLLDRSAFLQMPHLRPLPPANQQATQVHGSRSPDQASPRCEDDAIWNKFDGYT